jgi:uncharacterized protein (TIGR02246 family)
MNADEPDIDIREAQASFLAALDRRDAKEAAAVYAPDARLLPPFADAMVGRDAIEAFWQAGLDTGLASVEFESLKLARSDRIAYEVGRYAMHLRPEEGESVADRGTYVLVHERQPDGSWRRVVEMFGPEDRRG